MQIYLIGTEREARKFMLWSLVFYCQTSKETETISTRIRLLALLPWFYPPSGFVAMGKSLNLSVSLPFLNGVTIMSTSWFCWENLVNLFKVQISSQYLSIIITSSSSSWSVHSFFVNATAVHNMLNTTTENEHTTSYNTTYISPLKKYVLLIN